MSKNNQEKHIGSISIRRFRLIVILLIVLIVGVFIGHLLYVNYINNQVHKVEGKDTTQETYMDVQFREGSANSWVKRDFNIKGSYIDILGQTVDCVFDNLSSSFLVNDWKLTINIQGDCYINKAWNGTVEIHQYVGTPKEKIQKIDLMKCAPEDVKLDYCLDVNDIMIPLQKGDFIIYFPADGSVNKEIPIPAGSDLVSGVIFYYLSSIDLSDYTLEYHYHMALTDGKGFILLLVLAGILIIAVAGWLSTAAAYRGAEKEIYLKKSAIASMSDLYDVIYYIDLEKDELTPISADEESEKRRPKDVGAREQLLYMTRSDAEEQYLTITQEFIDISTVAGRLEKGSIACEYISKTHGWTLIRFFPSDRVDGEPIKKVIFAIQDINEEKRNLKNYKDQVEKEKLARNSFLAGLSGRTGSWLSKIQELNTEILKSEKDERIVSCSNKIRSIGRLLSFTIDGGNDASKLSIGNLDQLEEEYSMDDLLSEFFNIAETMLAGTPVNIVKDISDNIPCKLKGDVLRIQRVLVQILSDAVHYSKQGSIRFALYGKQTDAKVHLLFSIKDSAGGMNEDRLKELQSYIDRIANHGTIGTSGNGHGLEVAACILAFLGSRLNAISSPGVGTEFYFEIDQNIIDTKPIDITKWSN